MVIIVPFSTFALTFRLNKICGLTTDVIQYILKIIFDRTSRRIHAGITTLLGKEVWHCGHHKISMRMFQLLINVRLRSFIETLKILLHGFKLIHKLLARMPTTEYLLSAIRGTKPGPTLIDPLLQRLFPRLSLATFTSLFLHMPAF